MRFTVAHNRTKQEAKDVAEQAIQQLFTALNTGPIRVEGQQKSWSADTISFSFTANAGLFRTPIQGWAAVTDRDITVDVDLGLLGKLLPETAVKNQIEQRIKGLLT